MLIHVDPEKAKFSFYGRGTLGTGTPTLLDTYCATKTSSPGLPTYGLCPAPTDTKTYSLLTGRPTSPGNPGTAGLVPWR